MRKRKFIAAFELWNVNKLHFRDTLAPKKDIAKLYNSIWKAVCEPPTLHFPFPECTGT